MHLFNDENINKDFIITLTAKTIPNTAANQLGSTITNDENYITIEFK